MQTLSEKYTFQWQVHTILHQTMGTLRDKIHFKISTP